MDGKAKVVVGFVVDFVITEGHVAHGEVVEISLAGGLEACDSNGRFWVKLSGDASRDAVQLDAVQAAALHGLGQHPKEITHAH